MSVRVRRIAGHEGGLLRELRLASLREAPEAFGESLLEAESRDADEYTARARAGSAGDRRAWFVAEEGAPPSPIGLVLGRRRPPDTCLVFSMWVAPPARGSGVGRALLDAVEDWARAWGARDVVLWVFRANAGAITFYRRLGFRRVATGPDAEVGAPYHAWAMRRPISAER
ncbi:MAG: GCN5-like protein N-acetyltransferase [Chloroflexi bacterium CSP1-4]|nr:MAG: GCN5-like protein N-acetyltransferase [Chloroflexi bacterium CSP1-4]